MDKELKELDEKQEAICQQLKQRLTDLGKSVLYKQLTEVLKKKEIIYKKELENISNGNYSD